MGSMMEQVEKVNDSNLCCQEKKKSPHWKSSNSYGVIHST